MSARDVLAQLRLPTGALWIDVAEPWQHRDALALLEGSRPYGWVSRPRGGSKTSDAGACGLAWLLSAPPGARGYLAAADRDQAALGLDVIRGYLDRTPALRSRVELQAHRVLVPKTGASLETLPSDSASSWGLMPELLIADEFAYWSPTPAPWQFWQSLSSAAAKSPSARMLVISSPSSPSHPAYQVLEHARSDPMWWTSERTEPVPWLDPARVEEQRRRLPEAQFRRLFRGEWCEGDDQLAVSGDVEAAIAHEGPLEPRPGVRYAIGCDLGVRHDRSAVCVAHKEDERIVVDRIAVWKGSRLRPVKLSEVEEWIAQAARTYNGAEVSADPWQAISMGQRLRERGLRVHEFTFSQASTSKLAGTMVDLLRGQRLGIPNDPDLIDELRSVRLVERSPGSWRIDHAGSGHDDQVIAIALAAQHLLRRPEYGLPSTTANHPWNSSGTRSRPRLRPAAFTRDGSPERPFLYSGGAGRRIAPLVKEPEPNRRSPQ